MNIFLPQNMVPAQRLGIYYVRQLFLQDKNSSIGFQGFLKI